MDWKIRRKAGERTSLYSIIRGLKSAKNVFDEMRLEDRKSVTERLRETDRQTERDRDRQTETDRQRER